MDYQWLSNVGPNLAVVAFVVGLVFDWLGKREDRLSKHPSANDAETVLEHVEAISASSVATVGMMRTMNDDLRKHFTERLDDVAQERDVWKKAGYPVVKK